MFTKVFHDLRFKFIENNTKEVIEKENLGAFDGQVVEVVDEQSCLDVMTRLCNLAEDTELSAVIKYDRLFKNDIIIHQLNNIETYLSSKLEQQDTSTFLKKLTKHLSIDEDFLKYSQGDSNNSISRNHPELIHKLQANDPKIIDKIPALIQMGRLLIDAIQTQEPMTKNKKNEFLDLLSSADVSPIAFSNAINFPESSESEEVKDNGPVEQKGWLPWATRYASKSLKNLSYAASEAANIVADLTVPDSPLDTNYRQNYLTAIVAIVWAIHYESYLKENKPMLRGSTQIIGMKKLYDFLESYVREVNGWENSVTVEGGAVAGNSFSHARPSSHYTKKGQFGIDIRFGKTQYTDNFLPAGFDHGAHLLFGKTHEDGTFFIKIEPHGMFKLSDQLGHATSYVARFLDADPMGCNREKDIPQELEKIHKQKARFYEIYDDRNNHRLMKQILTQMKKHKLDYPKHRWGKEFIVEMLENPLAEDSLQRWPSDFRKFLVEESGSNQDYEDEDEDEDDFHDSIDREEFHSVDSSPTGENRRSDHDEFDAAVVSEPNSGEDHGPAVAERLSQELQSSSLADNSSVLAADQNQSQEETPGGDTPNPTQFILTTEASVAPGASLSDSPLDWFELPKKTEVLSSFDSLNGSRQHPQDSDSNSDAEDRNDSPTENQKIPEHRDAANALPKVSTKKPSRLRSILAITFALLSVPAAIGIPVVLILTSFTAVVPAIILGAIALTCFTLAYLCWPSEAPASGATPSHSGVSQDRRNVVEKGDNDHSFVPVFTPNQDRRRKSFDDSIMSFRGNADTARTEISTNRQRSASLTHSS